MSLFARYCEEAGIVTYAITSFPGIAQFIGTPRVGRGYSIGHPTGNPYITPENDRLLQLSIVKKALYALQQTPTEPTVYWGNYGNVIGDQESICTPAAEATKDWDWTIR